MAVKIELGEITAEVFLKDIKNIHLSVYPPYGKVKISAPMHMKIDTIRVYAISKLGWIKKQQKKMLAQERETKREYLSRESHYVWGKRYLLKVEERNAPPEVKLKHSKMLLYVRPESGEIKRHTVIDGWYRDQLKQAIPALIEKWEPVIGVKVEAFNIRKMKTKWGSCSFASRIIRLNLELAKKPLECLEYIVVHEMVHLLVPNHGQDFVALMNRHMPRWKFHREELNRLPVRHEMWGY